MMIFIILSLLLTLCASNVNSEKPVVRTPLGEVAGYYMTTRNGRQISAFTAIPFASPPLGDLRFKVIKIYIYILNLISWVALRNQKSVRSGISI